MERRELLRGRFRTLAGMVAATALWTVAPPLVTAQSTDAVESYVLFEGEKVAFPVAQDVVALEYRGLDGKALRETAAADAKALGLEVLDGVKRARNQVYVKASPEAAKNLVSTRKASLSGDIAVKPVFYYRGIQSERYLTVVPDTLVVAFNSDPGLKGVAEFSARYGLGDPEEIMGGVFRFAAGKTATEGIPALTVRIVEENPDTVMFSEPSYIAHIDWLSSTGVPSGSQGDPLYFRQWHHDNTSRNRIPRGTQDVDLDTPRAWNWNLRATIEGGDGRTRGYFGNPTDDDNAGNLIFDFIAVAVFDSGIDLDHPEWKINQSDPDNGPNPATSIIHPDIGVDAVNNDNIPDGDDQEPHGTAVAGIIAGARNNGQGGIGIAPLARIYSVRIGDDQSFISLDTIAQLVDETTDDGIDLGNHSYGSSVASNTLAFAFRGAVESGRNGRGTAHFVASGNDTTGMSYPALFDYTFSVGGVDDVGQHVDYASYGGKLDFVGFTQQPGRNGILTTDFTGGPGYDIPDLTDLENPKGDYTYDFNGTSAACPVVVGIAALVLAENTELTANQLVERLAQTADRYPNELHYMPRNALSANLAEYTPPPPPPPPEEGGRSAQAKGAAANTRVFGRPDGFRRNGPITFDADGFSPYFGYGQPNPYNAIVGNRARSPLRDYATPDSSTDPRGLLGDYGELEMIWASDLGADMQAQIDACRLSVAEAQEIDPAEVSGEDIIECIHSGDVPSPNWVFAAPRAFNTAADTRGPMEMGFMPYNPIDGSFTRDFEFSSRAGGSLGEGYVPCVIASTIPTGALSVVPDDDGVLLPAIEAEDNDFWYNPRGRYLAEPLYNVDFSYPNATDNGRLRGADRNNAFGTDYQYSLALNATTVEPAIRPYVGTGRPLIIEFTMRHELGVFDIISSVAKDQPPSYREEYDEIILRVNGQQVGLPIRGDTANQPLPGAVSPDQDPENVQINGINMPVAVWDSLLPGTYIPDTRGTRLPFRTYRYVVPAGVVDAIPDLNPDTGAGGMQISFTMEPGVNYVPQYDATPPITQIHEIRRDLLGFHLADLKIWAPDEEPDANTGLTAQDILDPDEVLVSSEGRTPVWSAVENELFFVGKDAMITTVPASSVTGTVKTALSDGGTRIFGGVNTDGDTLPPTKVARDSYQLFTALGPGSPAAPNHVPTRVLSLDASKRRSQLLYVKDGGNFEPSIWLTSDDGYGERPLFPLSPGLLSADRGTVSATFASKADAVAFTNGDIIETASLNGQARQFVVDSSNIKRTRFNDLALTPDDIFVVFSAETSAGDRGIYYIPQSLNEPNVISALSPGQYTLLDWPNSTERECTVSPDGLHVAFSSNTINQDGGTIPPANAPYRIYIAGNLPDVLNFGSGAQLDVIQLDMRRDTRYLASPDPVGQYAAGRWPRFSPTRSDVLAFTAYLNSGPELGEIAVVRSFVSPAPSDPSRPPTYVPPPVDPLPAAAAAPDDRVLLSATATFDVAGDGWAFTNDTVGLVSPLHSTESRSLSLISNGNNTNTYGYFRSPSKFLLTFPVQLADQLASCEAAAGKALSATERAECINNMKLPLYLIRYYVRRTTDDAVAAPAIRLRLNSRDFQEYTVATVPSTTGRSIPEKDVSTPLDLLFEPNPHLYDLPRGEQGYTLSFDLLNIYPDDDAAGGYIMDRVDIFRLNPDAIETVGLVRSYTFSTQAQINEWQRYQREDNLPFDLPAYTSGNGRLSMAATNPAFTFGYWYTGVFPNTTGVDGSLFLKYTGTLEADDTSSYRTPDMRFKLSRFDYSMTVEHATLGIAAGNMSPAAGQPRVLKTYLPLEANTPTTPFTATWDVLSFEDFSSQPDLLPLQTSNQPVHLDAARFDIVRVKDYPEALPNP